MPRAVIIWIEEKDFEKVEIIRKGILEAYVRDFSKHTDSNKIKHPIIYDIIILDKWRNK